MSDVEDLDPVAEDEQRIRALLARMFEAWANGDGEAYASCFTDDCDYITYNGIHLRGRSENASLHNALFKPFCVGANCQPMSSALSFWRPALWSCTQPVAAGRNPTRPLS
jgi:uncharacterized protein (TIGR02246 family)